MVWTASRWYGRYGQDDNGNPFDYHAYLDLDVVDTDHLFGSAGVNSDGWEFTLDVQAMASDPVFSMPGVIATARWQGPQPDRFMERKFWYLRDQVFPWEEHIVLDENLSDWDTLERGPGIPTEVFDWQGVSLSDCYDFPTLDIGQGFAEFDGTGSWIQLANTIPLQGFNYDYEYDIRRTGNDAMILGTMNSGRPYIRILGSTYYNGDFHAYPMNPAPQIGQWSTIKQQWRLPFGPTAMSIFVDGQLAAQEHGSAQQYGGFTMIGRYNAGTQDIWSQCDLRNLKLTYYPNVGPPVVDLDMPLLSNTCDISPAANHGTPFQVGLDGCVSP